MIQKRKSDSYSDKRWYGQLSDMRTVEKGNPTDMQKKRWGKFKKDCYELIEERKKEGKP